MSILVFGARGQVGSELLAQSPDAIGVDRTALDFAAPDATAIERLLEAYHPDYLINAAAYNAVDRAEEEPELTHRINAVTPALLAAIAQRRGIPFIHFSSDYVFDGAEAPYTETAATNPLGVYARSKLAGEQAALDAGAKVFRLQWVYGATGSNFYLTMRKLLAERSTLTVVADQIGAPTHAGHIAQAVLQSLRLPAGLYHMAAAGHTSWHGFACAIAQATQSNCAIAPITLAEYPASAVRPKDTRLDITKLATHGITLPHWREGLKDLLHATA